MKAVLISLQDHTGSGYKIAESVNLNSNHFVEYMVLLDDLSGHNAYKYPYLYSKKEGGKNGWNVSQRVLDHAQSIINDADIIHLKGDELPKDYNFYGLIIPKDKPKIITVSGSFFRRGNSNVAMPYKPISEYTDFADLITTLTPDLNYPELNGIYTPHTLKYMNNIWKSRDVPIINHAYSGNNKKATKEFLEAVEILKAEGLKFEVTVTKDILNIECLKQKSEATIFFDQMSETGWYGMSGIEAMAMGIPTVAYLSDIAMEQGNIKNNPVINCGNTVEGIVETLRNLITTDLSDISKRTFEYAEKTHSYKASAKRWVDIYEGM